MTVIAHRRVAPFGHPRIAGCVLLPLAYRSLPRPSSPSCAQASPTCFRSLDHINVFKQSTRDLRCVQRIQRLALDSFPTITTYEQLSNSKKNPGSARIIRNQNRDWDVSRRRLREDFPSASLTKCALTRRSVKEVIQPQVPLRLPCYDFAPVTTLAFGSLAPCGFRH
jgi:hypothetical protein